MNPKRDLNNLVVDSWIVAGTYEGKFFEGSQLESVVFDECIFGGLTSVGGKFLSCVFSSVTFISCDFQSSEFKGCSFIDCRFDNCSWASTSFEGCSFSSTSFNGLTPNQLYAESRSQMLQCAFKDSVVSKEVQEVFQDKGCKIIEKKKTKMNNNPSNAPLRPTEKDQTLSVTASDQKKGEKDGALPSKSSNRFGWVERASTT